jgi:hypothetical protein
MSRIKEINLSNGIPNYAYAHSCLKGTGHGTEEPKSIIQNQF